jgi:DHA3 family macrolide efflux protein-like MFS transporter
VHFINRWYLKQNWKQQFALIYAGQAFSLLGSAAVQFAVIWWLTIQTESAITLTLASIVSFLPNMLIGPFAGVWIDRHNRRTVMILADGLVAFSSFILGAAFLLNPAPPIWFIYVVLFIRGLGNTFHAPALQAAIPLLVPGDMLMKAGGWGNLVVSASTMLGPVLGAVLMGIIPIAGIMLVDIFGAFFAIICLLFITIPDLPHTAEKPDFRADFQQGFKVMRQNKPLMATLPALILSTIIYMPLGALFPLLVRLHFGGEAWHNGVVELVFSAGLLVSSLIMGIWGGVRKRFLMISLAIGMLGTTALISGLLPRSGFWLFVVCCFFMGGSGTFFNVPLTAYIQESTPPESLGKVFSLFLTLMTFAMPVGLLLAGPVTEVIGPDKWFAGSGVVMIGAAVICFLMTRRYDGVAVPETKIEQE